MNISLVNSRNRNKSSRAEAQAGKKRKTWGEIQEVHKAQWKQGLAV